MTNGDGMALTTGGIVMVMAWLGNGGGAHGGSGRGAVHGVNGRRGGGGNDGGK